MSSNSVAISTKLKYETWFMEGELIANEHYLKINDDFSNLLDVIENALLKPNEVKEIIKNANEFIKEFLDEELEELIGILVLAKYFYYSGQIKLQDFVIDLFK